MTPEDEEFNRIEMESRIKQDYVRDMKQPSREQLMAEVAVLTELVRVLSDRVTELEKPCNRGDFMNLVPKEILMSHLQRSEGAEEVSLPIDFFRDLLYQAMPRTCQDLIDEAVKAEREACAKIADEWAVGWPHPSQVIAERIRERT